MNHSSNQIRVVTLGRLLLIIIPIITPLAIGLVIPIILLIEVFTSLPSNFPLMSILLWLVCAMIIGVEGITDRSFHALWELDHSDNPQLWNNVLKPLLGIMWSIVVAILLLPLLAIGLVLVIVSRIYIIVDRVRPAVLCLGANLRSLVTGKL